MDFFDHSNEERADWRQHEVTKAYVMELKASLIQHVQQTVEDVNRGDRDHAAMSAGAVAGLRLAVDIMERDK